MGFFERHKDLLKRARTATRRREHWAGFSDSLRSYPENAAQDGEEAFRSHLNSSFDLDQPGVEMITGGESSPHGLAIGITYPWAPIEELIAAGSAAMAGWGRAAVEDRIGVCLEILQRLNERTFEIAHAVMQMTGQPFLSAFQQGGPQALDRGLEATAQAYREMARIPSETVTWEKPQGRMDPIQVQKRWTVRPRGLAVTMAASIAPTWSSYPGLFASLATGNAVIVKPHPKTILPLAIAVQTARSVLAEAGHDPNVVLLALDKQAPIGANLATNPAVGLVDYTGRTGFGDWLERNVRGARVFSAKSAANSVILDSVADLKAVVREIAISLAMHAGQMCTSPQNIFIPTTGVEVDGERVGFDEVLGVLVDAVAGMLADDQRAADILGAIKNQETLDTIAAVLDGSEVALPPRSVRHPDYPEALVRSPAIVVSQPAARQTYMAETFGPLVHVIPTEDSAESLRLAAESAMVGGGLSMLLYTRDDEVIEAATVAAVAAGVNLVLNPPGGVYVNHPAAFSDFHGTRANPAGNAVQADSAFVSDRFQPVGIGVSDW